MTCGSIRSGLRKTPSPPLALSHSHISLMLKSLSAAFAGERVGPIAKQCRAGSPPHWGEQLSFLSYGFGLPFSAAVEHGIEGDDELSHDRDDGDLGLLAGSAEALLEGLEVGVPDGGGLSGHEEDASTIAAAAADTAQAAHFAAVGGVGHGADEGGALAGGC